jgi:hypothetical protein
MKRGFLLLAPLALAAIVFAQGADDPAELVKKLGSDDYAAREEAQQKLVDMGEKAIPALEEALKSDDLEVRLRAGRALRAIGARTKEAEEPKADDTPDHAPGHAPGNAPAGRSSVQSMRMTYGNGKVTVTITDMVDGKEQTKTYEGASLEELKEKYPELKDRLGGRIQFGFDVHDEFDMDKFWHEWNKSFDSFDDDMRDARREFEAMRRWFDQWNQPRRLQPDARLAFPGAMLGVRASAPTQVLDAQLELRGRGIVIDAVEKDTTADRLGIQRFDVLVELNGHDIRGSNDVAAALRGLPDGAKVTAKVVRRSQMITLTDEGHAAAK